MTNILIVEDDKTLSDAYRLILLKEKHTVRTAANGKQALEQLIDFKPDIILLDLLMPEMDGIEFLKNYDLTKHGKDTKVVILSNVEDDKKVKDALGLGASRYIVKAHATPDELARLVNHMMQKI